MFIAGNGKVGVQRLTYKAAVCMYNYSRIRDRKRFVGFSSMFIPVLSPFLVIRRCWSCCSEICPILSNLLVFTSPSHCSSSQTMWGRSEHIRRAPLLLVTPSCSVQIGRIFRWKGVVWFGDGLFALSTIYCLLIALLRRVKKVCGATVTACSCC